MCNASLHTVTHRLFDAGNIFLEKRKWVNVHWIYPKKMYVMLLYMSCYNAEKETITNTKLIREILMKQIK